MQYDGSSPALQWRLRGRPDLWPHDHRRPGAIRDERQQGGSGDEHRSGVGAEELDGSGGLSFQSGHIRRIKIRKGRPPLQLGENTRDPYVGTVRQEGHPQPSVQQFSDIRSGIWLPGTENRTVEFEDRVSVGALHVSSKLFRPLPVMPDCFPGTR